MEPRYRNTDPAMTRICITALLAVLLSAASAPAQHMDKAMFLEIETSGNNAQRALLAVYLRGVLNGLEASNMDLLRQGRPRLFCSPPGSVLATEWLIEQLLAHLERYSAIPNNLSIAVISSNALAEQFPCEYQVRN